MTTCRVEPVVPLRAPTEQDRRKSPTGRLPRMLTVAQVAEALQLSGRQVRRLIKDGRLPVYRPTAGAVRIAENDLLRYLETTRR